MRAKIVATLTLVGGLATTACDSIGQAMTAHTDVLARAAGHELKVDKAAALILANPQIPAQPDVAIAVANLWVDYMLLAVAAQRDSTLRNLALDIVLQPIMDQEAILLLREQVIKIDTIFTDDELKKLYDDAGNGVEVRARHVLLRLPADATPAQRDSTMKLAQQIQDQARAGSDFAAMAKKYSADGSASEGGDLGWYSKNTQQRWVTPFEDAAFKLQAGQVSEVVETPFGFHVIKMDERKSADFTPFKEEFRQSTIRQTSQKEEEKYIKGLSDSLKLEVQEGAYEVVRDLSVKVSTELKGRAASRALVKYKGDAFTARDYLDFIRTNMNQQTRAQLAQRADEELKNFLESLARQKVLVSEASRRKLTIRPARLDSLRNEIWNQLSTAVRQAGLINVQPQEGESKDQALERRVNALIEATIKGEQNVIPLGALSFSLRDQFGGEVFERAVPAVVSKVEAARPPAPQMQGLPQIQPQPTPPPPTTTTGN